MKIRAAQLEHYFRLLSSPTGILLCLTSLQLLYEWLFTEAGHFMSFWDTFRWHTIVLFVAAMTLWYAKLWSYPIAISLSAWSLYGMRDWVLGSAIDRDWEGMFAYFTMQLEWHPEYIIHAVLAAIIFGYAWICLIRKILHRRVVLS